MVQIEEYVTPAWRSSREEFQQEFPHPFLLLRFADDERDQESGWRFRTETLSSISVPAADARTRRVTLKAEAKRYRVFEVKKRVDDAWPDRITVGRARNTDIMLPDSSVSKLHAQFYKGQAGEYSLVDMESRNGTRLNDDRLTDGRAVVVRDGDTVAFGRIVVTLLNSGSLYDFVRSQILHDE